MSKKNAFYLVCALLMVIGFIFRLNQNYRDEKLLLNSKEKIAFITRIREGGVRQPKRGYFVFYVNTKRYEFSESGDYLFMKVGDTVLVKYAVKDHGVATVVDKYYMKKYKHLKREY